eukprot:218971-Pyramimonas_sp.AAC.2
MEDENEKENWSKPYKLTSAIGPGLWPIECHRGCPLVTLKFAQSAGVELGRQNWAAVQRTGHNI